MCEWPPLDSIRNTQTHLEVLVNVLRFRDRVSCGFERRAAADDGFREALEPVCVEVVDESVSVRSERPVPSSVGRPAACAASAATCSASSARSRFRSIASRLSFRSVSESSSAIRPPTRAGTR